MTTISETAAVGPSRTAGLAAPPDAPWHRYTPAEELANALTHGLAALLSVAGLAFLVTAAGAHGTPLQLASLTVYGLSLVMLYGASALYHTVRAPRLKARLGTIDHAAIFLLIAGTYTPFMLISLGGPLGIGLCAVLWALAVLGVACKLRAGRRRPRASVALYLGMGWLGIVTAGELWIAVGPAGFLWLLLGGLAYTLGIVFYAWHGLRYHHAVWHLFVMAGSGCHFAAVFLAAVPGA
jgi:hemolysin III